MAYLVKNKKRPFWLLRYHDTVSGKFVQKSTGLRIDDRNDTRKARAMCEKYHFREQSLKPTAAEEAWENWVPAFLQLRYGAKESEKTRLRYETSWRALSAYLKEKGAKFPRQVQYQHVRDYFAWRQAGTDPGVRRCQHNTALFDLKFLGILIDEALRLGFAESNPCRKIGIKRRAPKVKPAFTDEDIAVIRQELCNQPEWMLVSFEIAIRHGTRLRATRIDLQQDVDWQKQTVTFHEKGHKVFTTPLSPDLLPLFERLKAAGKTVTCELPVNASKSWGLFFRKIGMPQYSFHCARVTTISKLARSGVPENHAMKFVGHASTEIHRIYQRLRAEDLQMCHEVLKLPSIEFKISPPGACNEKMPKLLPPLEMQVIYDSAAALPAFADGWD